MKKEFKAPIVETKELFVRNGIMAEDLAIFSGSGESRAREAFDIENSISTGFNAWKGFGN